MATDEKPPIAENEAPTEAQEPAQDAALTKEEFVAQMQLLTERARAAGLKPLQTMAATYTRQWMVILEGLVASLEDADSSKKKKA